MYRRYIYITRGLRYAVIMTPKKVSFMIGISWLFPIVWSYGTLLLLNVSMETFLMNKIS